MVDARTDDDITHEVLTQIILEEETRGPHLLPTNFLRQLIRFYGDDLHAMVPAFLEYSIGQFARSSARCGGIAARALGAPAMHEKTASRCASMPSPSSALSAPCCLARRGRDGTEVLAPEPAGAEPHV